MSSTFRTMAHCTSGDAVAEVIRFEGDRVYARVTTTDFRTMYLWLPMAFVMVQGRP